MSLSLYYYILSALVLITPRVFRKYLAIFGTGVLLLILVTNLESSTDIFINFNSQSGFFFTEAKKSQNIFSVMFSLVAFIGSIFLKENRKSFEHASSIFYVASGIGVLQSYNLISFFIFWELLTLGGTLLILHKNYSRALYYLLFHAIGGLLFLLAILLSDDYSLKAFSLNNLSGILLFLSVGINSSFPFLSSWLTESYPRASSGGTLFLAAITTKTAIFSQIIFFRGEEFLIPIGLFMCFIPLFFAFFAKDVRELLAYSLMNPLGFMLIAIGIGSNELILASKAHVLSHISYKSLLFIISGIVLYEFRTLRINKFPKLYEKKSPLFILAIIAGFLVSLPGSASYVSKSLILENVSPKIYIALFISSILLFIVTVLRFIDLLFFSESNSKAYSFKVPKISYLAIFPLLALLITLGVNPNYFNLFLIEELNFTNVYSFKIFVKYFLIYGLVTFFYIYLRKKSFIKYEYKFTAFSSYNLISSFSLKLANNLNFLAENSNNFSYKIAQKIIFSLLNLKKHMYPVFTVSRILSIFVILFILMFFSLIFIK